MADPKDIQELHSEHQEWLSDIAHWERELDFLEQLTRKVLDKQTSESLNKAAGKLENQAYHHKTLLKNLKDQIQSHEAFIKDQLDENFEHTYAEGVGDHYKTRNHVKEFKTSLKGLKHEIFELCEEAL
jgi:hypothetical protein